MNSTYDFKYIKLTYPHSKEHFMKLYLIRHGQTDWNTQGRVQGSIDSELNETSLAQAKELGTVFREEGFQPDIIFSSRQKRAKKTAEILRETLGIQVETREGLEEMKLGVWEGMTWAEIKETYPREFDAWTYEFGHVKTPSGESYQQVLDRALVVLREIIALPYKEAVIVTHGAVINALTCHINRAPLSDMMKFKTKNASITITDSSDL